MLDFIDFPKILTTAVFSKVDSQGLSKLDFLIAEYNLNSPGRSELFSENDFVQNLIS